MIWRHAWIWALLGPWLLVAPAAGQTRPVQMPDGGALPAAPAIAPKEEEGDPDVRWDVRVVSEGIRGLSLPEPGAPPAPGAPLPFLARATVFGARHQGASGVNYLLLGILDQAAGTARSYLGWIPEDCILDRNICQKDRETRIEKKAMIVNTAEGAVVGGKFRDAITLRAGPAATAAPRESYALFNVFWVYKRSPANGSADQAPGRGPWVLIGNGPYFTPDARDDDPEGAGLVVRGWLPESQLIYWPTREGVEWDRPSTLTTAKPRRLEPGTIYLSPEEAHAAAYPEATRRVSGRDVATPGRPADENLDAQGVSIGFRPHHMRFPILEWEPPPIDSDPASPPPFYNKDFEDGSNSLIKIGAIGGFGGLTRAELDDQRKKADQVGRAMEAVEILIVLDSTGSMLHYVEQVNQAIERIESDITRVAGQRQSEVGWSRDVKLAVAFYNDRDPKRPDHDPVSTMPLRPLGTDGAAIRADAAKQPPANGGDVAEMVAEGIRRAIADAHFSSYSRKLVVLIGDHGDKCGDDLAPMQALADSFRPSSDAPIELVTIQAVPPTESTEARQFDRQVRALGAAIEAKKNTRAVTRPLAGHYALGKDDVSALISQGYKGVAEDADRVRKQIDALRSARAGFHTKLDPDARAILTRAGVKLEEVLRASEGELQIFREGYVWKWVRGHEGTLPQVGYAVLLSSGDLEGLINDLNPILNANKAGGLRGPSVRRAMRNLILELVGEEKEKDFASPGEVFLKAYGLKVKSPLLTNRPEALGTTADPQLIETLAYRIECLKDIKDGIRREYRREERNEQGRKVIVHVPVAGTKPPAKADRGFTLPGSPTSYYWIYEGELP